MIADEDAKSFAGLFLYGLALVVFLIALLAAWQHILELRYAPMFKPYFAKTCFFARDEDVLPEAVRVAFALLVALVSAGAILTHALKARRISAGIIIASVTFVFGVLASAAI